MGSSNKSSSSWIKSHLKSLKTHQVKTLTELCRIERAAASCETEEDAREFQEPMTAAWTHYVASHQMLVELRGFSRSYPFCSDIVDDARMRVVGDPDSNRSWNLAWLCLVKMKSDNLLAWYASVEAAKPEMWGAVQPDHGQVLQLASCFEHEWTEAVDAMLRHWRCSPTWY